MQWFENEVFWRTFYPYMFDERRFPAAPEEVDRILALSGVARGAVLLAVLRNVRDSLKKDGVFPIDVMSKEYERGLPGVALAVSQRAVAGAGALPYNGYLGPD